MPGVFWPRGLLVVGGLWAKNRAPCASGRMEKFPKVGYVLRDLLAKSTQQLEAFKRDLASCQLRLQSVVQLQQSFQYI